MRSKRSKSYDTKDIHLAAALSEQGLAYEIRVDETGMGIFSFGDQKVAKELSDQYWSEQLMVSPKSFSNRVKELKSRIRSNS